MATRIGLTRRAAIEAFEPRRLMAVPSLGPLPVAFESVDFDVADLVAHPTRNLVYVADATAASVRVVDTGLARQVAAIPLAGVPGELAISPDGSALLATLPASGKVQVISTATFSSARVLDLGVATRSPAIGVGNQFYAAVEGETWRDVYVVQFDLVTGSVGAVLDNRNTYGLILRTDRSGTHLYTRQTGVSGGGGVIEAFDISDPGAIGTPDEYAANQSNSADLYVDEDFGRMYTADGGVYGLGTVELDDGDRSVWPFEIGPYAHGVASYPGAASVWGQSGAEVVQFDQATGVPQHYYVSGDSTHRSLVATPNGRLMWIGSPYGQTDSLGIIGASDLTLSDAGSLVSGTLFDDGNLDGSRGTLEVGSLDAYVYLDLNGDGALQRSGAGAEPAVRLAAASDGAFDLEVPDGARGTYALRVADAGDGSRPGLVFADAVASRTVTVGDGRWVTGVLLGGGHGARVAGHAYHDLDGDGAFSAGDATPAVDVYLDLNNDGARQAGEPLATATADGFSFDVRPGLYTLRAPGAADTVLLDANEQAIADLRLPAVRALAGSLFRDVDRDGKRDRGIETPYAGIRVWLDLDQDGKYDRGEPSDVSGADGAFFVRAVAAVDNAPIRYAFDGGGPKLKATASRGRVTLAAPLSTVTGRFGLYAPASLSVAAFFDADRNRKYGRGDQRLAYTVLYIDLNNDGRQDRNERSVTTDADGLATMSDLPAGRPLVFRLRVSSRLGPTRAADARLSVTLADGEARAWNAYVRPG